MTKTRPFEKRIRQEREQIHSALQKRLLDKLAHELVEARSSSTRVVKKLIETKLSRWLAQARLPLTYVRQMQFSRSANRRDTHRSLVEIGVRQSIGSGTGAPSPEEYQHWIDRIEPTLSGEHNSAPSEGSPDISVLILAEKVADLLYLQQTLSSILSQSFSGWQVTLIAGPTAPPTLLQELSVLAAQDARITLGEVPTVTTGYVLPLRPGDRLPVPAFDHIISASRQSAPRPKFIYGDDDRLSDRQLRSAPRFKPPWNRDMLYCTNYIGRFALIDAPLFQALLATQPDLCSGLSHLDLLVATAGLSDEEICHIPRILCHLAHGHDGTLDAPLLEQFMQDSVDPAVQVIEGRNPDVTQIVWPVPEQLPHVCLILPTRDQKQLIATAVTSILDLTDYPSFEVMIIDNGSTDPETLVWLKTITEVDTRVKVLHYAKPFNYSAINNFAVENTNADIIGLLNNDVEVMHSGWLREMVSHCLRPGVGCVGAKLHFTNSSIQHAGVALGIGPVAGHIYANQPAFSHGYLNQLDAVRTVSAVTGACLLLERRLYQQVGGLDAENLVVACNDVDLCLKAAAQGKRSVWTPHAVLFHHESASRGQDDSPEKKARLEREQDHMCGKWQLVRRKDAFTNPHVFNWI